MDRKVPAPVVDERLVQAILEQKVETAISLLSQMERSNSAERSEKSALSVTIDNDRSTSPDRIPLDRGSMHDFLEQANLFDADTKLALIRRLIPDLGLDQIQSLLEFGQREIAERQRQRPVAAVDRQTRLLLKKDYSYQSRGLSEPNQYYVYLRRRRPKLDRYIGTLFYVPQGCTLCYEPDAEGRIMFAPPHNVFLLKDFKNAAVTKMVRLLCLEPPPADYTFTKQQNDNPEIYLRLQYLDPKTYQPLREESYAFPFCMYEGGQLDRYRWDVTMVVLPDEISSTDEVTGKTSKVINERLNEEISEETRSLTLVATKVNTSQADKATSADAIESSSSSKTNTVLDVSANHSVNDSDRNAARTRRVIELPVTKSSTFYLVNRCDTALILERMHLWIAWNEKAMPQSRWELVQNGTTYTLMNASFKRNILKFSLDRASVSLENSLPALMRWFHDLGLAISQSQNQKQFSPAQLKLAHSLFVDMSLPQNDPLEVLKKLFGVEFSKTSPH